MYYNELYTSWHNLYSHAVEVARNRDPVCYSMMMELDQSSITETFYKKVK